MYARYSLLSRGLIETGFYYSFLLDLYNLFVKIKHFQLVQFTDQSLLIFNAEFYFIFF